MKIRSAGVFLLVITGCAASDISDTDVGEQTAALTSTQGLDTSLLYDAQYYESLYPDLQAAFGSNLTGLHQHWLTHGIYEGRRASPVFDCAIDLQLTGRTDGDCAAAMAAWQSTGLAQGQRASNEFDPVFYLANNADLRNAFGATGYVAAAQHFLTFGLWQEERAGSNEFDVSYYICHATDLANAFFGDPRGAAEHWATIGLPTEGLRGSRHFDVQTYLGRYPDLRAAFGTNYVAAMAHWLVSGIHEGRSGDPYDNGGVSPTCATGPSVPLTGSFTTSAQGFPSRWFGVPLPAGTLGYAGLNGSVTVTNSANIYAEELFIIGYLPASAGACISGAWPASTPEFGPPGMVGLTNLIVKAPTAGTFRSAANFVLPGQPAVSGCLMIGLNGGTVSASHSVTSAANLVFHYEPYSGGTLIGGGAEYCFGQNWGCQGATTDNTKSFAVATHFPSGGTLRALFGNISDSTFDGTPVFGALPPGAWTATNDFYVYHGAECNLPTGPGNFYAQIPSDAVHVASFPVSGNRIGVSTIPVYTELWLPVSVNDCMVTLFGVNSPGGFDNETQVSAIMGSGPR